MKWHGACQMTSGPRSGPDAAKAVGHEHVR